MSQNLVKVEKSRWPPIVSLKSPQYFIQQISNSLHSQASYRTGKEILAGPREGENSIVEIKGWSFADLKLTLSKFYWEILKTSDLDWVGFYLVLAILKVNLSSVNLGS